MRTQALGLVLLLLESPLVAGQVLPPLQMVYPGTYMLEMRAGKATKTPIPKPKGDHLSSLLMEWSVRLFAQERAAVGKALGGDIGQVAEIHTDTDIFQRLGGEIDIVGPHGPPHGNGDGGESLALFECIGTDTGYVLWDDRIVATFNQPVSSCLDDGVAEKAFSPILTALLGIVMPVIELHELKARSPMLVTLLGMTMSFSI